MKIIALRCNLLRQIQEASPALDSTGTDIINVIDIKYIEIRYLLSCTWFYSSATPLTSAAFHTIQPGKGSGELATFF